MNSAGLLTVRASLNGESLERVEVCLQRPSVTQLFIGQIPEAVVKTIPYLYTLCAHAQRAAAQAALSAAMGEVRRPVDAGELWIEMLHENLWRLLLDWPTALALPSDQASFVAWRAARHSEAGLDETRKLLAGPLRQMAEKCLEKLGDHAPPDASTECANDLAQPTASLAPAEWLDYWQGQAALPPVVRQPTSIVGAYRARLAEIKRAAQALVEGDDYPVAAAGCDGWGVAQTRTARGVLTHAVHVDEGRVLSYRVAAPTDAFFADAAPLLALLASRRFVSREAARQGVEQAILALDPCLPYTLELNDA